MTAERPERVLVVGSSVAGVRTAQALRAEGHTGELTLVGAEPHLPYDKPPLSKEFLAGTRGAEDIRLLPGGPEADHGFTLRLGRAAVALDVERRRVRLADGELLGYDALVLATGVRPRTLPAPVGKPVTELPCFTVRELSESAELAARLAKKEPVIVVGGGFIGAEAAATAAALGCPTTLAESGPAPFAALGPEVGALLAGLHADHGVEVLAGARVNRVEPLTDGWALVRLDDGRCLEAATVIVGIGCVPNTEWLESSGLGLNDGVVTDEYCAVPGADGVWAVGDVSRWYDRRTGGHRRVEHWTSATEQAALVARALVTGERRPFDPVPYLWSDQHGVKLQMVGRRSADDHVQAFTATTPTGDRKVVLYSRDGRLTAAVTFGWPRGCMTARQAWAKGADIADVTARLAGLTTALTPLDLSSSTYLEGNRA
ncbi:FAD-dependent oxidoreductase [Streptomyces sp. TRM S81-3]|uniref:FAD-dependent oxidoreductase n=1 Tax=Streptomyces griseicoloratus TaxID=2752516 RepID=A0A926QU78_9ACTN|nr:FAD-dependent oxidoreductase [Streptomyces griseicoloratus]MBD0423655.1 FAD-dependent oxidoreductase [Streptomyces griseicoloratus]